MIIKYSKISECTSQHPSFLAKNLLEYRPNIETSTWLCEVPGILVSSLILELAEPAPITGIDIGNSRCCTVDILGSTNSDPENWTMIISHNFISERDAEDGRFKDQVQLFTKKEINEEIVKIVFSRVKVVCRQPANRRVLFGLSFLILRTEDKVDTDANLDNFGRFKVKQNKDDSLVQFKEKFLQQIRPRVSGNFKTDLVKQMEEKRASNEQKCEEITPRKRPSLNLLSRKSPEPETSKRQDEKAEKEEAITRPTKRSKISEQNTKNSNSELGSSNQNKDAGSENSQKVEKRPEQSFSQSISSRSRARCSLCLGNEENVLCKTCNLLKPEKEVTPKKDSVKTAVKTPKKPAVFKDLNSLFQGVVFSLSGYQNPKRDDIRRKAIAMGARYLADPNGRNNTCTHLICAFKNTPKYYQLKGKTKIISHRWIEECYDKKTRFPWRRFALDHADKNEPESEDEVVAGPAPQAPGLYDQDTDSDY